MLIQQLFQIALFPIISCLKQLQQRAACHQNGAFFFFFFRKRHRNCSATGTLLLEL